MSTEFQQFCSILIECTMAVIETVRMHAAMEHRGRWAGKSGRYRRTWNNNGVRRKTIFRQPGKTLQKVISSFSALVCVCILRVSKHDDGD